MKRARLFLLLSLCAGFAACEPDDDGPSLNNSAGRGGITALRVIPEHHNIGVDSAIVYIAYNRSSVPPNGRYDDSARTQAVGAGLPRMAIFDSMKTGNYYLYCEGYDPSIGGGVDGGSPYTISRAEPVVDMHLPVGEE